MGIRKPVTDHLGNEFESYAEMYRHWGTNQTIYHYRTAVKGWDMKTALETPPMDTDMAGAHECEDHLGNKFESIRAMCDYWRIPRTTFFQRRAKGWDLEKCLSPIETKRRHTARHVSDGHGNDYESLDAMCAAYDITKQQYIINIRNNLSVQDALTARTEKPEHPKDHKGVEYDSINALCRAYGITKTVLRSRLELGWTLAEILENPENHNHYIKSKDHENKRFSSQKAMLDAHGVSYATYTHRIRKGCDIETALTADSLHLIPSKDCEGNEFPCQAAMLEYWLMTNGTYANRKEKQTYKGPGTFDHPSVGREYPGGVTPVKKYGAFWLIEHKGHRYVVTKRMFWHFARQQALIEKIKTGGLPDNVSIRHIRDDWFLYDGRYVLDGESALKKLLMERSWRK